MNRHIYRITEHGHVLQLIERRVEVEPSIVMSYTSWWVVGKYQEPGPAIALTDWESSFFRAYRTVDYLNPLRLCS